MSSLPIRPWPGKPKASGPNRSVRLHFPYHRGNPGSLTITVGTESSDWLMWEVPSEEGLAYRIEKVGLPAAGPFTVFIDPLSDRRECSCLRFLRLGPRSDPPNRVLRAPLASNRVGTHSGRAASWCVKAWRRARQVGPSRT
jgi:hypothetical protein